MTVHHGLALAAVLVGLSALEACTETPQTLDENLPRRQRLVSRDPIYLEGIDVDVLRAQAEQGDASAQLGLGRRYEFGQGVPQDDAEAVLWYRLAAEQGNGFALSALGSQGVPQDYAEALRWDRLGADQRYPSAQYILGVRYANGEGVRQDDVEAHMWFNLAAAQSSGEARRIYVKARDDMAERMTAHQLAVAQGRAREWTPTPEP